jgi:hypothetical protein
VMAATSESLWPTASSARVAASANIRIALSGWSAGRPPSSSAMTARIDGPSHRISKSLEQARLVSLPPRPLIGHLLDMSGGNASRCRSALVQYAESVGDFRWRSLRDGANTHRNRDRIGVSRLVCRGGDTTCVYRWQRRDGSRSWAPELTFPLLPYV